ncbi:MAG: arsenate reductase ArsC [Planctomycetota bacterium]
MAQKKQNVLFLCTGNSCRSQMGEAILRQLAGDRFRCFSAGTDPHPIHPLTVQVLDEMGIDISGARSKDITEYLGKEQFRYVIIVCDRASRSCPRIFPGMNERVEMFFEDPVAFEGTEEETLAKFRETRDKIRARLQAWLASLPEE